MFSRNPSRVIVWDDPALLYLRVPKSANTSIRLSIPGGRPAKVDPARLEDRYAGHLSFSFVRNPWARLVSIYVEKLRPDARSDHQFSRGVHRGFLRVGLRMRADMPFAEFAEAACSLSDDETEKHLKSQSSFLVRDGRLLPRFLGKVETIVEDWRRLGRRAGFEARLPHHNRTKHAPFASFYDGALLKLVGDRYREDVERFGYDFPGTP